MARMLKWSALALGLAFIITAAIYVPPFRAMAGTGAGFVAKQMCSCIYVSERSYDSCRPDMMEVMDDIQAVVVSEASLLGVRASVPILRVQRLATYEEGFGCTLD